MTVTVKDLIEYLSNIPGDYLIFVEVNTSEPLTLDQFQVDDDYKDVTIFA